MTTPEKDDVLKKAPSSTHYKHFKIEPLEYIEANNLNFDEGNVVKYVSRWRAKNGIDDLRKAKFYIERLIALAEEGQDGIDS